MPSRRTLWVQTARIDNAAMSLVFRLLITWIASAWRPALGPSDTLVLARRVGLLDLDLNLHMNHARFLGVVEQALLEGLQRSGFLRTMLGLGAAPMLGGTLISYRRELRAWQAYRVRLNYLGADARWHVFAFCFLDREGQVAAQGFVKGGAVRWRRVAGASSLLSSDALWLAHVQRHPGLTARPALPPEALAWLALEREINAPPLPSPPKVPTRLA